MKPFIRRLFPVFFGIFLTLSFAACEREGPAERAGERIDEGTERAREQMEETTEKAGEKLEKPGEKTE